MLQDIERRPMADSPLARVQRPRPSQAQPRLAIPEKISLPDGREFVTRDLLRATTKSEIYNLRRNPKQPVRRTTAQKYTWEERIWCADATLEQIQQRFTVTDWNARKLRCQGRKLKQYDYLVNRY